MTKFPITGYRFPATDYRYEFLGFVLLREHQLLIYDYSICD
jgi:hypothetical protein